MSTVKDVTYFFKFSPIRADHLEKIILSKQEAKNVKAKLLDPHRKRWVARIDILDLYGVFDLGCFLLKSRVKSK